MNKNLKIVVVYGGTSTEREVSLNSGKAVSAALKEFGFTDVSVFDLQGDNVSELIKLHPDLAFLALHGKGGEDGCIQGALELAGIPYTGPGVSTSAICMNKIHTKQILSSLSIPTPKFECFHRSECVDRASLCEKLLAEWGVPVVLKSPCQGSSIGVVIVRSEEDMPAAIDEIFRYGDQLLVEEYMEGTEVTLPIIGNEEPVLLPEIEITSERDFYDYTAKYTSGLCHHIIPARIPESDRAKLRMIGERVYRKLGCCGLSRIDFIIDRVKGPMVIEINTLPGMTSMSLVPDAGRAMGLSFAELTARIVEYGLATKR